jgi:hypothetical protein
MARCSGLGGLAGWPVRMLRYTVIGVTAQELAISAMVNCLES